MLGGNVTIKEGDQANFVCTLDANPIPEGVIQWELQNFPPQQISQPFPWSGVISWRDRNHVRNLNETTSMLTIYDVDRSDAGLVTCSANNGVHNLTVYDAAQLVVNREEFYYFHTLAPNFASDLLLKLVSASILWKFGCLAAVHYCINKLYDM